MEPTHLLYLENFNLLSCEAKVMDIAQEDGRDFVVLDQTVLYPQGGGQPYDQGMITSEDAAFLVDEVRFVEGVIKHYGHFDHGKFAIGDQVACVVDEGRRQLHSRLHSAGHVVDMALKRLDINWKPGKGYHFPQGPYVEYQGDLGDDDREQLQQKIEHVCNELIQMDAQTKLEFVSVEQAASRGLIVDPHIAASGKPIRIVLYGDFGILCGGTHVNKLSDIGRITIRKVKPEKDMIKVSYNVE